MSAQAWIVVSSEVGTRDPRAWTARDVGGKAAALAALGELGVPVPAWLCMRASAFAAAHAEVREQLGPRLDAMDAQDRTSVRRLAEEARAITCRSVVQGQVRGALFAAFDREFSLDARVAVRSSAVGEDSARDSFAGQLDSYLYVSRDDLLARVADCVASAYTERALVYRQRRGIAETPHVAVVVQRMIDSRASGVLFTANPTTGDRSEAVVSACLGLGEGVVAGRVETDTFFLGLEDGALRHQNVAEKHERIVRSEGAEGTRVEEVMGDAATAPVISDLEAKELVALGRKIQVAFGAPQDIEWAIDASGHAHILQARPITTLERETIFDSSNIVESFPGITLPLTFSFVRRAYEEVFRDAQLRTGIPAEVLEANRHVHENLVGLVRGRVYYNILHWYRMFTWVPGFESLLPAWEKALGIDKRFVPRRQGSSATLSTRVGQARVIGANVREFVGLQTAVEKYLETLAAVQVEVASSDLEALDAHELLELVATCSGRLLQPYSVSVLNDLYAQQLYDALLKRIVAWRLSADPNTLRNELLCGERGVESVAPVRSLVAIACQVRASSVLSEAFETLDDRMLVERLRRDGSLVALREALDEHLRLYGDRTLEELKLETQPLKERPEFLVAMIRNYVRGKQNVEAMETHEAEIRRRAEEAVRRALGKRGVRARVFEKLLADTRRTVKNRENLRLARSRAYGIVRTLYRAIAHRFVQKRLLDVVEDLFFLTTDEVDGAIRGSSVTTDLRSLVALRRSEYHEYAKMHPAPRLTMRGIVLASPVAEAEGAATPAGGVLRGVACSPGRRVATAKVMLDPEADADLRGEILVAPMTDPAWAYLMAAASGLVAERGSILSHTAIIGRELGIPTVVAVPGATRAISSGETIEIDGAAGTVRIFGPAADAMEG